MKTYLWPLLALLLIAALTGCGGSTTTNGDGEPTLPPVRDDANTVLAEGSVEPARWVVLTAPRTARVNHVPVAEGDTVAADQVLMQFDATEIELGIQQAEAALAKADARLDQAEAGTRPEQLAIIEAQLAAAEAALSQAIARRQQEAAHSVEADVAEAQAQIIRARQVYEQVEEAHDNTMECFDIDIPGQETRTICPGLGPYEEITRFQMEAAYAALVAAQAQLDSLRSAAANRLAAAEAQVGSAEAQRDTVQAEYELAQAGSTAEQITAAQASVQQAQAALEKARAGMTRAMVEAPFGATVTDVAYKIDEVAGAGTPAVTLATLNQLQIETRDLNELQITRVELGQPAIVTLDAQPDQPLVGKVIEIEPQSEDYLGDVTYTVVIELGETPPEGMRWGMTALVEIQTNGAAQPSPSSNEPVSNENVLVEGALAPERWSELSFTTAGEVIDIPVAVGDTVAAGDLLIQLDTTDAAMAVAEAEAGLAAAEAQLDQAKAQPRAEEIAAAEARLERAERDLAQATAQRNQLAASLETALAGARSALEQAQSQRHQAQLEKDALQGEGDAEAVDEARERLAAADLEVQAAQARLDAQDALNAAQLREATAGIQAATAQRNAAQAELELVRAGKTAEAIALAEADVAQAEAALAAAQDALERLSLYAPFDGTITQIPVEVGNTIAPGQSMLVLATLDRLQVETIDLTELDVMRVEAGQAATITPDARQEQPLAGHVVHVDDQATEYRGDVTYPATIAFDEPVPPELRWGMTVLVMIEAE